MIPDIDGYVMNSLMRQWSLMSCLLLGIFLEFVCNTVELSFAAQVGAGAVVYVYMVDRGSYVSAVLVTVSVCVAIGIIKGFLFAVLPVSAIVTSIGLQLLISGLVGGLLGVNEMKESAWFYGPGRTLLMRVIFAGVLSAAIVTAWVMRHTYLGCYAYLTGKNRREVERMGVPCGKVIIVMHGLAGVFFALTAIQLAHTSNSGDVAGADFMLYQGIMGACIGGVGLLGGRGSVSGALSGAFSVVLIQLLLTLLGYAGRYQNLLQGFIILAVLWEELRGTDIGKQHKITHPFLKIVTLKLPKKQIK
jgi:ribose/xylose/arabinose/galactoside ABC-type transport system permease subunit